MSIILIVLNYNDANTVRKYVFSIKDYAIIEHIIIVDNHSTDNSFVNLLELANEKIDVIQTKRNGGYGYGNNYGMRYALKKYHPKYFIISNPDVRYGEDTVSVLYNHLETNPQVGIAAPVMKMGDSSIAYYCAWKIRSGWNCILNCTSIIHNFVPSWYFMRKDFKNKEILEADAVAGSFFMVRAEAMKKVNGYDENIFLYAEETTLGIRLKKEKIKTHILTKYSFTHYHSVSINKTIQSVRKQNKIMWQSRKYILKKYFLFNKLELRIVDFLEWFTACITYLRNWR